MSNKFIVEDIKRELINRLPDVLHYLLPKGKFQQGHFLVGDVQGNEGESLKVTLSGNQVGKWRDFATEEYGDILSLWAKVYNLHTKRDFNELLYNINHWLEHGKNYVKPSKNNLRTSKIKWDYFDGKGNLIACVYRYDTPTGKTFRPWDAVTKKHKAPNPRPLYNQPQMLVSKQVILCEGEKAAQALIDKGFCATTAMNGAKAPFGKTDWSPLADKDVILWPDKDKPGFDYAQAIGNYLSNKGIIASLTILEPPQDKPDKWDAADAIAENIDIEAFLGTAKPFEVKSHGHRGLNIYDWKATRYIGKAPQQNFLIEDVFPLESVSILAATGDSGKSMLLLDLALAVATGSSGDKKIAFGKPVKTFGTAVIFTAEDDKDEVHRRLERLDPKRLRSHEPYRLIVVPLPSAGGTFPLVQATKEGIQATKQYHALEKQLLDIPDLKLIVFDPLSSFIQADVNADPAAGSVSMGLLASLAVKTEAALIITHHMRKPQSGKPIASAGQAREAIRGTSALVDGVRLAYALWPASQEHQRLILRSLDKPFVRNAVYQGAVVKANASSDRTVRSYVRNDAGLLTCVDEELKQRKIPSSDLQELLLESIAQAAQDGHPFTHTGISGVYKQRHRLPAIFHEISRHRLERMVQKLLNAIPHQLVKGRANGSKEDKWLDVPDGPFARDDDAFEQEI